jgi:hypothetical protein
VEMSKTCTLLQYKASYPPPIMTVLKPTRAAGRARHSGGRSNYSLGYVNCFISTKGSNTNQLCTRTDIETPHILEKPFVIASTKYQNKTVRKSDNVCPKAVSRELAPYRCLASSGLNILHLREMDRVKPWKWIGARVGVGRVPFVGESSGAEQPTVAD